MKLKSLFTFLIVSLFTIPAGVFAHGTEEEHRQEVVTNPFLTSGIVISAILLIAGVIVLFMVKSRLKTVNVQKQEGRIRRDKLNKCLKISQWVSFISLISFIVTGAFVLLSDDTNDKKVEFMHIHGLGYVHCCKNHHLP
ncbi:hypothetical protein [Bacillus sp. J33]|uniref:hypothetical protein n=1 Tax=Bacillus sp. J33 TaxID=935836 RepID=UPI00047E50FB|nr:hypothetical protein [Bacillus sp. J33]